MARRKSTTTDGESRRPTFEEALDGLEKIVETMEHEHLALEELVSHYEKGSELLKRCESMIKDARNRIDLITLQSQNDNSLDTDPQIVDDATNSLIINSRDDSDDQDNEIRLF
ncbi:MAG: exodeoxyribonuclease VII small subunit [Akkermansiaceae bacterium]|nr:exodeoxyribonuclease VII small subunit [Akkermansiaceae bacterium]